MVPGKHTLHVHTRRASAHLSRQCPGPGRPGQRQPRRPRQRLQSNQGVGKKFIGRQHLHSKVAKCLVFGSFSLLVHVLALTPACPLASSFGGSEQPRGLFSRASEESMPIVVPTRELSVWGKAFEHTKGKQISSGDIANSMRCSF